MRIIPTIHIFDGKCIPLIKGVYDTENTYNENPIEVAKEFEGAGLKHLHLSDLDGVKANHIVNYKILEQITSKTNLKINFGGGLKSDEDVHIAFNSGAKQIIGNSIVVEDPEVFEGWLSRYGGIKIILGADFNSENHDVSILQDESDKDVIPFIKSFVNKGIKYVICTDITQESKPDGPTFELYKRILNESKDIKLMASGGITTLDDLNLLEDLGCEAAIIGNPLFDGKIRLRDLETY